MTGGNGVKAGLFLGLRFVLAGFEEEAEKQFADEIVENGGQVFKRYDSSCTHVVVSNLPLNDTVCRTARKDGKILVTDFWITDCLETDALVDSSHVLYRPLNDVDGIDGSNKLCICLTGYQGLARKNIMRMVEMMGAKFSKPLIGSQVTHLVCYKFEGEKYELAKKMGMALVNHFWLEDSLNCWTLLPESSYAQSGWDAETLKAEQTVVDDSGEEDSAAAKDRFTGKRSSFDNISITHAQFLDETNGNLIVDDNLNKSFKSEEKSKSLQILSPLARSGEVRNVGSAVDRIVDGSTSFRRLEQMSTVSKSFVGEFPLDVKTAATDTRNGSSVPYVEEDESTHLYVEEGYESDHSCGRTSYGKEKFNSNLPVVEMCEPVDAITTTCRRMEMMDFATGYTTRPTGSDVEDQADASGDETDVSSGIHCRRRSQFTGQEEPPLKTKSPADEDAPFAELLLEQNFPFVSALNQQPVAFTGSNVSQEILACPSSPGFPVQELPQEMEECDPKHSRSTETSAMEISSNNSDHLMCDIQGEQAPSTENNVSVDQDHVMQDVPGGQSPSTERVGLKDQHRADADIQLVIDEAGKSIKTTDVKLKKKAVLKANVRAQNSRSVALALVAQSYNPSHKEKRKENKKPAADDKENHVGIEIHQTTQQKAAVRKNATTKKSTESRKASILEPSKMCFAVGGTTDERTKLHSVIKIMGARICKSRYQWRDEATHVILPGPLRRTEKFLAGAAAGRWILKPEYLEASRKAGKFLDEEAYEWYGEGTNDKGSISLLAPRKWRMSVASSGVGAFHGLRVLFHGECISPPLDTMKRAIKAGGGVVLATAPPYTRHLADGVNFAVISPGIPKEDAFVKEFLTHEVACVLSEYLVNLVCHPSSSLEEYILYGTENAARQHHADIAQYGSRHPSFQRQKIRQKQPEPEPENDDVRCSVCGSLDGEDVMLLCGPGEGKGCGVAIHIQCCTPPLCEVPDEDWYCPKCASQMT